MMAISKAADIASRFGSNISESMGANRVGRVGGAATVEAADRDEGTKRLRTGLWIELERITALKQAREDFDQDGIDRLAASLLKHGQVQPILVRWDESLSRYVIIAGERRFRAAKQAGLKMIKADLDEETDLAKLQQKQLVENMVREDLKPIEQANAFRDMMAFNGWSAARLGEELKVSEAKILRAVNLLQLPEPVQDLVNAEKISPTTAYEVSKVPSAQQQAVADRVVGENLTVAETARVVDEVRKAARSKLAGKARETKGKAKLITSRTFKGEGGLRITAERSRGLDLAALLAAMEVATETIRGELSHAG